MKVVINKQNKMSVEKIEQVMMSRIRPFPEKKMMRISPPKIYPYQERIINMINNPKIKKIKLKW